jgi:hypothetical protein
MPSFTLKRSRKQPIVRTPSFTATLESKIFPVRYVLCDRLLAPHSLLNLFLLLFIMGSKVFSAAESEVFTHSR